MGPLAGLPVGEEHPAGPVLPRRLRPGRRARFGPNDQAAEFLERFRWWPEALLDGAVELVNTVRTQVRVGCLSNTNAVHWDQLRGSWGLDRLFDVVFLSHEMGLLKPEREIFERVSSLAGCANEHIAFLDDSASNVEPALDMGFQARKVCGVDEATAALVELGVLRPE